MIFTPPSPIDRPADDLLRRTVKRWPNLPFLRDRWLHPHRQPHVVAHARHLIAREQNTKEEIGPGQREDERTRTQRGSPTGERSARLPTRGSFAHAATRKFLEPRRSAQATSSRSRSRRASQPAIALLST